MIKLFRSIIFVLIVCGLVASSWANIGSEQPSIESMCKTTWELIVINSMLENEFCHYNGGNTERFLKVYAKLDCNNVLSEEDKEQSSMPILDEMLLAFEAYGQRDFCRGSLQDYVDTKLRWEGVELTDD